MLVYDSALYILYEVSQILPTLITLTFLRYNSLFGNRHNKYASKTQKNNHAKQNLKTLNPKTSQNTKST